MKRVAALLSVVLALVTACSGGSSRPPASAPSTSLEPLPTTSPLPLPCPVPDDAGSTGSKLVFTGACPFAAPALVPCPNNRQNVDDYYIRFTRKMSRELTIYVSMNVERYHGPGTYSGTTAIIVEIPSGTTIYEWSTSTGSVTVDSNGTSGSIPRTPLGPAIGTPTTGTEYVEGTFTCQH
jgi:hypothetical protein